MPSPNVCLQTTSAQLSEEEHKPLRNAGMCGLCQVCLSGSPQFTQNTWEIFKQNKCGFSMGPNSKRDTGELQASFPTCFSAANSRPATHFWWGRADADLPSPGAAVQRFWQHRLGFIADISSGPSPAPAFSWEAAHNLWVINWFLFFTLRWHHSCTVWELSIGMISPSILSQVGLADKSFMLLFRAGSKKGYYIKQKALQNFRLDGAYLVTEELGQCSGTCVHFLQEP